MTSGEQAIERAHARLIASVPYAAFLGLYAEQVDDTRYFHLPFQQDLIGNVQRAALHGGAVAGFLELAMQFEVLISQNQQRAPHPVDFSIDYWRSAQTRDVVAACRLIRQGRRIAQVQAECWQQDRDRPVAFARAGFLLRDVEVETPGNPETGAVR